jgi:hypothetical protein
MDQNFSLTTDDLGKSKERAFAKAVLTKKLTNGKKEIGMNTTHTKEPIEQKEKPKGGQLFETIDLRDYFAAKAMQAILSDGSWHGHTCKTAALESYEMADAMLRAREAA